MTVLGIDISKWDGNWNADKAKQAGATFVFIKTSQANNADPKFLDNWKKAKDAGLLRGAYHYLDYTKPGIDQANFFADQLKDDPGELPPVIDYELRRTDNNPSAALVFLRDFLDQMTSKTDLFQNSTVKRPMIYTSPGFWVEYGDQTKGDYWIQFPLWLAHWTTSSTPNVPLPWTMWQFWQFSSKGPGDAFGSEDIIMDMNRYNGTLNELMEFAGVRVPVINLPEMFETLDEKVNNLEGKISSVNYTGDPSGVNLLPRVDNLDAQVSNLGIAISTLSTNLTKRITVVEQMINTLESVISVSGASSDAPATPAEDPSVTPSTPPSDPPESSDSPDVPAETSDPPVVPSVPPVPQTITTFATCNTSALNVRNGPAKTYSIVAVLQFGQRVKVIAHQDGWAQLEDPAGWSDESYLTFEQSTTTTPAADSPSSSTSVSYGICNTSGLNVRGGPGVSYPIVGYLIYGQQVIILGHQNGWAQIKTPAGWCNESYLSFA
jgi:GH25 family lysozyme M1 (1,4-beta-N-acetylmuramidase)/uncharacterized protein YraI